MSLFFIACLLSTSHIHPYDMCSINTTYQTIEKDHNELAAQQRHLKNQSNIKRYLRKEIQIIDPKLVITIALQAQKIIDSALGTTQKCLTQQDTKKYGKKLFVISHGCAEIIRQQQAILEWCKQQQPDSPDVLPASPTLPTNASPEQVRRSSFTLNRSRSNTLETLRKQLDIIPDTQV